MQNDPYDEVERAARLYRACKQRVRLDKQTPEQVVKDRPACREFNDEEDDEDTVQAAVNSSRGGGSASPVKKSGERY